MPPDILKLKEENTLPNTKTPMSIPPVVIPTNVSNFIIKRVVNNFLVLFSYIIVRFKARIIKNKVINKEYIFISSEHYGLRGWYLGDEYPIAELPINVGIKCRLVSADIENKIRCYEPSPEIDFLKIKCGHSMWGYWMHDTVTYEFDYTDVTRTVVEKADLSQMPEACKY